MLASRLTIDQKHTIHILLGYVLHGVGQTRDNEWIPCTIAWVMERFEEATLRETASYQREMFIALALQIYKEALPARVLEFDIWRASQVWGYAHADVPS